MRSATWFAVATLVLVMPLARAETIFVNNLIGNDRATGRTAQPLGENGPVRTLAAGSALVGWGDRLVIANTGEPYREMLCLAGPFHSGSARQPFVVEGNGAVLDGTVIASPGAWRHVEDNVFAFQPRRLTYQQFFHDGQPLRRTALTSHHEVAAIEPREWALINRQVYFRVDEARTPESYSLRHAGLQTGITLYQTQHVRIENLVLQGFQQDGVNAHELVRDCELIDIECRANGRSGLSVGGVSDLSVTRGNFYDNGRVQVRSEGHARLELVDCDVAEEPAPAFKARGRSLMVNGNPMIAP